MEIEKVCKVCGLWFVARSCRQVYCSDKCKAVGSARASAAVYKRKKEEKNQRAIKDGKVCPVCGKVVLRRGGAKYCSKSCAWKAKQGQSKKKELPKLSATGTLCWHCEWATGKEGKCPWARSLKPVPGWTAKKVTLKISKGVYTDSYIVKECPLFREG